MAEGEEAEGNGPEGGEEYKGSHDILDLGNVAVLFGLHLVAEIFHGGVYDLTGKNEDDCNHYETCLSVGETKDSSGDEHKNTHNCLDAEVFLFLPHGVKTVYCPPETTKPSFKHSVI